MVKVHFLLTLLTLHMLVMAQSRALSLSECVDCAICNSLEVKDYENLISITNYDIRNEKQKFFPSLSARITNGVTSGFQQVFSESMAGQYETVRAYSNNAAIGLSVPIWSANAHKTLIAKKQLEATSLQYQKSNRELDITIDVIGKFYNLALAENRYEISCTEKQNQDSVLAVTKRLFSIGEKSLKEVTDAEANLQQNVYDLKVEEYNIENARRQLADVMRINEMPDIVIDDVHLDVSEMPSFESFYQLVIHKHPAIESQDVRIKSAERDIKYFRRSLLPSVTFNYEAGTSGQLFDTGYNSALISQWKHNAYQTAQISINIPIYNYSSGFIQFRKAQVERDRAIDALEKAKQDLRDELEDVYMDMIQSGELLSSLRKTEEITNQQYDYALKDYNLGNMASYELNIYKTKRKEAQLRSIQAEFELKYKYSVLQLFLNK